MCAALDAEDAEVAEAAPAATGPRRCPAATCCTARPPDRTGRPLPRTCWPPVSARRGGRRHRHRADRGRP
ncbi:hypothetical protein O1L55_34090, partial [Streptomyces albulus]|nr:hypothetical protein [Streptomyces noursei]